MNYEGKKYQTRSKSKEKSKEKKPSKNRQKQENEYGGRYIQHEKIMSNKSNIINSTSIEQIMKKFFKRDSLLNWQISLISRIEERIEELKGSNFNRRKAYNDMMSYRNYHSNNNTNMSNEEIINKIARVLVSN